MSTSSPGTPESTGSFATGLAAPDLQTLMSLGRTRVFAPDSTILLEGHVPNRVYLLLSGRVKVHLISEAGREVIYAELREGAILGEISAIDGLPSSASVTALDRVECLEMSASNFLEFVERTPGAARYLLGSLAHRLRQSNILLAGQVLMDVTQRVAARLVEQLEAQPDGPLAISQEELAAWAGCTREAVAKSLATLRSTGIVRTARRRIEVLNPVALRILASRAN